MISPVSVRLDPVYPLYLRINSQGDICELSDKLAQQIGMESVGKKFLAAFNVVRPLLKGASQPLTHFENQLFLFRTPTDSFAMRGELRMLSEFNGDMLMLVTPWLAWMLEHKPERLLPADCFPAADAQLDLQIYLGSQQMIMDDLQKLLTQLKQANAQATLASDAKTQFINHVSHELRTPLNGIASAVELLGQNELNQESRVLVDVMQKSSSALLTIVNEILDYSNSVSSSGAVRPSEFDPGSLCQGVIDILTVEVFRRNATLELQPATESTLLLGDAVKLKNILLSLVTNAIKHAGSGKISIAYRVSEQGESTQTELYIEVRDSGPGLNAELREKFFDQPSPALSDPPKQGLGLWVAQTGVRLLGGEFGLEDNENEPGSCFWFKVPVTRVTAAKTASRAAINPNLPPPASILLVDDNAVNLKLARLQLERLGMIIDTASSGEDALKMCQEKEFSLILMDIQMPGLTGVETTSLLRTQASYSDTPIIAWTANASNSEQLLYRKAGISDILPKPASKELFSSLLKKWLGDQPE